MRKKGCGSWSSRTGTVEWARRLVRGDWGNLAVMTQAPHGPGRRQTALCFSVQEAPWRKGPEQGSEPSWGRASSVAGDALGQKLGRLVGVSLRRSGGGWEQCGRWGELMGMRVWSKESKFERIGRTQHTIPVPPCIRAWGCAQKWSDCWELSKAPAHFLEGLLSLMMMRTLISITHCASEIFFPFLTCLSPSSPSSLPHYWVFAVFLSVLGKRRHVTRGPCPLAGTEWTLRKCVGPTKQHLIKSQEVYHHPRCKGNSEMQREWKLGAIKSEFQRQLEL